MKTIGWIIWIISQSTEAFNNYHWYVEERIVASYYLLVKSVLYLLLFYALNVELV